MAYIPQAPSAGSHLVSVTPSDSTVFDPPLTGLYVAGAGDLALLGANDTVAVTLTAIAAKTFVNNLVAVSKVMATNTTATGIVGFR